VNRLEFFAKEKNSQKFIQTGRAFFYRFLDLLTPNTQCYPPTKDFLISTTRLLAQYFIANNPQECVSLLGAILSDAERIPLLSQFFNPANDPSRMVDMFKMVMQAHLKFR
jgi:hypothetical protein